VVLPLRQAEIVTRETLSEITGMTGEVEAGETLKG
jgi:hypothetical protein